MRRIRQDAASWRPERWVLVIVVTGFAGAASVLMGNGRTSAVPEAAVAAWLAPGREKPEAESRVCMTGDLSGQLFSGAGEVAKILGRFGGHETAAQQAMREQIGDPYRILHIALSSRDVTDVHRVGKHQIEAALQHVPDRFPVDTRGFHGHVRTTDAGQPVGRLPLGEVK